MPSSGGGLEAFVALCARASPLPLCWKVAQSASASACKWCLSKLKRKCQVFGRHARLKNVGTTGGLLILVRKGVQTLPFKQPGKRYDDLHMFCVIRLQGTNMAIGNVYCPLGDAQLRSSTFRAVRNVCDQLSIPTILCGDFNCTPQELWEHVGALVQGFDVIVPKGVRTTTNIGAASMIDYALERRKMGQLIRE